MIRRKKHIAIVHSGTEESLKSFRLFFDPDTSVEVDTGCGALGIYPGDVIELVEDSTVWNLFSDTLYRLKRLANTTTFTFEGIRIQYNEENREAVYQLAFSPVFDGLPGVVLLSKAMFLEKTYDKKFPFRYSERMPGIKILRRSRAAEIPAMQIIPLHVLMKSETVHMWND